MSRDMLSLRVLDSFADVQESQGGPSGLSIAQRTEDFMETVDKSGRSNDSMASRASLIPDLSTLESTQSNDVVKNNSKRDRSDQITAEIDVKNIISYSRQRPNNANIIQIMAESNQSDCHQDSDYSYRGDNGLNLGNARQSGQASMQRGEIKDETEALYNDIPNFSGTKNEDGNQEEPNCWISAQPESVIQRQSSEALEVDRKPGRVRKHEGASAFEIEGDEDALFWPNLTQVTATQQRTAPPDVWSATALSPAQARPKKTAATRAENRRKNEEARQANQARREENQRKFGERKAAKEARSTAIKAEIEANQARRVARRARHAVVQPRQEAIEAREEVVRFREEAAKLRIMAAISREEAAKSLEDAAIAREEIANMKDATTGWRQGLMGSDDGIRSGREERDIGGASRQPQALSPDLEQLLIVISTSSGKASRSSKSAPQQTGANFVPIDSLNPKYAVREQTSLECPLLTKQEEAHKLLEVLFALEHNDGRFDMVLEGARQKTAFSMWSGLSREAFINQLMNEAQGQHSFNLREPRGENSDLLRAGMIEER